VPLHLEFLQTPLGTFGESQRAWHTGLATLDYAARRQVLRADPIYALYCD
jgi:hypothetical protein